MRHPILVLPALLAPLALAACSPGEEERLVDPEGLVETDAGLYAVRFSADPDPFVSGEPVALGMELYAAGTEDGVEGASIVVTPWMPDMGHGISDAPVVTEQGGGRYEATFTFSMGGYWELGVDVDASAGTDSVAVPYEVQ